MAWTNRVDGNADIHVRDFDADGEPVLDSKTLNTYTASNQMDPAVAVLDQGTVVVWTSNLEDGSGYGVYARVASPSGIVEFRVNTTTSFDQFQPAVAALADGSFVVTWTGVNEFHAQQLYSRRFSADGTPIDATEVAVHQPSHSDQYQSVVTALSDGGYVVAWTSATDDDVNITDIYLQRFGADGQPAGDPVLVNEGLTEGEQREPAIIGLPTGGFMVAWTSWGSEDSSLDVYAQRFGTDGLPLGDRVLVNSLTTDKEQTTPAIAVLADGSVVITWQSNTDQGGDNFEVYAQHFNAMTPWFIEGASGNREDVVPVLIAPTATVSDIELEALNDGDGDWSGARLVLQREQGEDSHSHHRHHGRGGSPDHFEFQAGQGYTLDEQGLLLKDGLPLGRLVQAKGRLVVEFGTFGEIDLSGYEGIATPTTADVNHVLQHLAYWNSSDGPGDSVVLQYRMEDGNEGTQGLGGEQEGGASVEVRILDINDAPQARRNGELLLEDHSHTFDASDFRFRDAEGDELRSVTITSLPGDGKLLYDGRELTQEDLECEDGGFTIEACDLSKLQFVPADNFHGRVEFNYYLRDDGGTERGGQDTSEEATFRINVMSVNDAPELDLRGYTFVVTALDDNCDPDDGKLSLREALALAGDGDSITFATSLSGGTIELDSTLAIASNVYINGQTGEGCEGITLRTNGGYTAIDVTACVTEGSGVVLSNLSIRGDDGLIHTIDESDGPAAALVNGGTLTLHQVEVSGYHQQSADGTVVSVLWNKDGAVLRASELELEDNAAFGLAGQTATLILNEGSMDLTDPSFEHNHVTASSEGGDAWLVLSDTGSSLGVHEPWYIDNELNATHENGRQGDILYAVEDCEVDVPDTEFRYEAPDLRARYTEDSDCGVRLMPHARVTDVELDARSDGAGNWAGASIMIAPRDEGDCEWGWFTSDPDSELGLAEGHCLSFSDGIIYKDAGEEPVAIGNYEIDEGGALLISFPKSTEVDAVIPTSADVNNILRLVTYRNTSQDPADTVTFGISVSDGNGRFFGRQGFGGEGRELGEVTVVINAVNDAPEFDLEAHPPVVISREEDETYVFGNSDFPFTDVEGDCLGGVVITSLPVDGFLAVDGRIVTATQVDCDGFFVSAEDIACGRFTFTPAPDYHGVASFEYRVRDDGGTDNGGVDTTADTATFTFDVRSVNDAPELKLSATADYTFVVTTLEDSSDPDDGKLSLREALALACDGDSITFDPALLSGGEGRIVLESTLAIDKQVYINGAVAGGRIHLVRDECLDGPMVAVSCDVGSGSGGAVLQGLVLDGDCVESSAPALVNAGHLVMHEVTITDQQAVNDSGDVVSALLNEYGGVLVATSLTVSGNSAQAGAGGDAHAILNRGRLTVDELSVSGNTQSGGDSVDGQGGDAFALYNDGTYYQGAVDFCDNNSVAGSGDDCGCDAGGPGRSGDSGGCEAEATGFALMFVAPALTGTRPDAALTYVVGSDAVRLAPDAVLSDVELGSLRQGEGNWSGARIEIRRAEGADGDDVFGSDLCHDTLAINESGEITKLVEGTERVIGSYTATGGVLAIHFTGHGTAYPTTEDVNAILRSLTYSHASEEFEGTVDLVVTVRDGNAAFDGPQGAGSEGAPGEGIVTGTIQVNVELVPLSTPLSVMLVNDAECVSDGITGSPEGAVLLFDVTFADEELVEGQQVRLYRDGELFGSQVVGAEHLINGIVTVSVSTTGLEDFDFSKVVARVAADENSSRESGDSPAFFLTYDTVAPEPPLFYVNSQKAVFTGGEVEGEGEGEAAGGALLFTGTAEAFSTVRLSAQTFAEGGELGEFVTQADADGRFSLHMAFPGMYIHDGGYNIRVVVEDRAGNVSIAIPLDEYISSSTTTWIDDEADITTGHVYTDSGVVGFRVSDSMHAGRVGTEWMIAPSAQYASVFLEGVPEDYTFTLLEGDVRADAISLASSEVVTAIGEGPLYLMEYWGSSSETRTRLYLQVDAVHFSDGASIGLSADGVHVLNLTTPDEGHSAIQGGAGNERLVGSSSVDALFGGDGDNVLIGGGGDDVLVSYGAADQAGDVLMGGEGNDILIAMGDSSATGPVSMYGGAGSDIFAIAPVEADDLWFNQALSPRFNRDVTIHDFVIGEDRIDLSWVYAAGEGDTYRRITGEDLDIQSLAEDLQDDGVMTIDLTQFFTADGTALEGTLNVQLAGGSTVLTGDSFMLGDESMMDYLRGQEYLWDALRIIEPL